MWNDFVTSGRRIGPGDTDYRKLYLTNTLLATAGMIFAIFFLLTFFVTRQYAIAFVDLFGALVSFATIYYLRKSRRLFVSSAILVGLVFILTLISIYLDTYPNMNLVWIYVIPLTAIFLLEHKWGVRVVFAYTLLYLVILWLKTGQTQSLVFGPVLFANLVGVLVAVTVLTRYFDISRKEANEGLEKESKKLQKALDELNIYKHDLEIKVAESVGELREKDKLLIQQAKMASMGEMIAIIAHQLKQPLTAIALVTQDAREAQHAGELDEAYISELSDKTMRSLIFMSSTIDNFKNFLIPGKKKADFSLRESIRKAVEIIMPQLKAEEVAVVVEGEDKTLFGVDSEMQQVVINLLVNAKEAIKANGNKTGMIRISLGGDDETAVLTIRDNGGGIDRSVIDSLFDSYVTGKEESGTGLGLYMVKLIVLSMQGKIRVDNWEEGAEFIIELPCKEP